MRTYPVSAIAAKLLKRGCRKFLANSEESAYNRLSVINSYGSMAGLTAYFHVAEALEIDLKLSNLGSDREGEGGGLKPEMEQLRHGSSIFRD